MSYNYIYYQTIEYRNGTHQVLIEPIVELIIATYTIKQPKCAQKSDFKRFCVKLIIRKFNEVKYKILTPFITIDKMVLHSKF